MPRQRRFSASWAGLLIIGLAWVVPFLQPYHRYPLTSFYSEWLAFALALAGASVLLARAPWREPELPVIALAPLGLVAVLGLQVVLGRVPYAEQALVATLYLVWAALLVLLAAALKRELGLAVVASALAWFTLFGGLLGAAAGLLQHYAVSTPLDFAVARKTGPAVFGNLAQPNHFAAHVALALACVVYLYGRGRLHVAWAGASAVLLLVVLALSASRSAWLYLTAFAAIAFVLPRGRSDSDSSRAFMFALCLVPGFVAAQWLAALSIMRPDHGLLVTSGQRLFEVASGIEARLQLAREAWSMFLEAPLVGAGFGQFAWHHFLAQGETGPGAAPGVFNHAHNILLHLLAETGIIGAALIVGAAFLWLADLARRQFDLESWWLLALVAVIGIHSLLEFPLWYAYFLGPAAILMGLGATRVVAVGFGRSVRVVVALTIVAGWFNLVSVLPSYRGFERLVFLPESAAAGPADERTFAEAIARIHREPLLTPYVELTVAYGATVSEERLHEKLELTSRAARFAPADIVVYRQALLLALAGERAAAERHFERAARAYPAHLPDALAELAELARRRPGAFTPLLELPAIKSAELPARGAAP